MTSKWAAALLLASASAQQALTRNSFLVLRHQTTTYNPGVNVTSPVVIDEWALDEAGATGALIQVRPPRPAKRRFAAGAE